jgi:hypothetical protein
VEDGTNLVREVQSGANGGVASFALGGASMSDVASGPGWWMASDGKWYPPETHPDFRPQWSALPGAFDGPGPSLPTVTQETSSPVRGKRRRRLPFILTAVSVATLALVATVVVESHSGGNGSEADTAVVSAVDTAIAGGSANLTATSSIVAAGQTVTVTGTGSIDFTNSAVSLNLTANAAGQQINEQAVYLSGVVYEQLPEIAQVAPGKSWVSLDLSSLTQAAGQGGTDLGGNPLAMLHVLALQGNTVTDGGVTTLGGQSVHEYDVSLNPAVIQKELDSANFPPWLKQAVSQVTVHGGSEKVYIDDAGQLAGSSYVVEETAGAAGTVSVSESLRFSDYGTPVSISAPPADEVIPFSQLLQLAR